MVMVRHTGEHYWWEDRALKVEYNSQNSGIRVNSVQYARLLTASGISGKKTTEHEDDDENWFRVVGHVCVCLVEWPSMTLAL